MRLGPRLLTKKQKNEAVVRAAVRWFRTKRPVEFVDQEHLDNPEVNTVTDAEQNLAIAVADYLKK
jgi:hypothetical protein